MCTWEWIILWCWIQKRKW